MKAKFAESNILLMRHFGKYKGENNGEVEFAEWKTEQFTKLKTEVNPQIESMLWGQIK